MDAGAQHIYICEHHKNVIQVKMRPFGPKTLKELSKDWNQLTKKCKKIDKWMQTVRTKRKRRESEDSNEEQQQQVMVGSAAGGEDGGDDDGGGGGCVDGGDDIGDDDNEEQQQ